MFREYPGRPPLKIRESSRRIAEAFQTLDSHAVGHAEEKVRHRLGAVLDITGRGDEPAPTAGKDDREIVVGVPVGVGVAAAVDDHRIVQDRVAVDVLARVKLAEEPGELLHIPLVDLRDLADAILVIAVLLLAALLPLGASGDFRLSTLQPRLTAEALQLDGGFELGLSPKVEEALGKGIELDVLIDIELERPRTLLWNDPTVGIRWPMLEGCDLLLSPKDSQGLLLDQAETYE